VKRHGLDPVSLVFGLLFVLLSLFFLTGRRSVADVAPVLLWSVPLVALGLLALLGGITRLGRSSPHEAHEEPDVAEPGQAESE